MDTVRPLLPAAASLGGGLLVAFSLPPWGWWPLAWIGVAMYVLASSASVEWRDRAACGFLFGFGWLAVGTMWMWELTIPGYLAASVVFSLYHAVAGMLAPAGRWRVLALPVAHTLVEALRMSFPFGGIPLATLGISQVSGPLAGIARVGGVIAITWVTLQLGAGLAVLVSRALVAARRGWSPRVPGGRLAAAGCGVAVLTVLVAMVAPRGHETGDTLTVAAIQGGGEQGTRADDVPSRLVTERHLEATAGIEPDPDLDLVLWPENVVDAEVFDGSWQYEAIVEQAQRLNVPFSVGVIEDVPRDPDNRVTNAQLIITPDGEITSRYEKVRRVPFGEYVPLRGFLEALGAPIGQVPTNAIEGTTPAILELPDGNRTATVISWEVFFGGRAREGVKLDAGFISNPTNGASYSGTIVQTQQVASSRLRALENGRWVVQAAPTGFTAIVDADGSVLQRTSVSEQRVLYDEIAVRSGYTWYTRLGDAPFIVGLAVALAAVWGASRWGRQRQPSRADDDADIDRPVPTTAAVNETSPS